jgi:hypothetical protein
MDANKLIETYVLLRDKKKALQDKHKEELEPFDEGLMKIEAKLMDLMESSGVEKLGGAAGTAFTKVNTSVTVSDWEQVLDYVRENDAYDLLERRVAKTAAMERGDVRGLSVNQTKVVQVRRK